MDLTANPELSSDCLNLMNECVSLFRQNPMQARSWESVHNTINACAPIIHLMRAPVIGHPLNGITDSAGLVKRFYNETVGFIMGEERTINLVVWEGLINDVTNYNDSATWPDRVGSSGSIGARLDFYAKPPSTNKVVSSSFKHDGIRNDLLSYAHRDILHKWIHRKNGIDDMLFSLVLMAKIYSVYEHSSLKG